VWVRVHDFTEPATVDVFAHAVTDVPESARLLREINELNVASSVPTFYWSGGLVAVKHSLLAASVDCEQLRRVCGAVGTAADHVGTLMTPVYGGTTPFPPVEVARADGESK